MLPLVGRLRLMMFVSLLSLFVTCLLLFLDISHIVYLFPFNWGKVVSASNSSCRFFYIVLFFLVVLQNAYFYVSLSVLFLIASSLIFHTIFLSEAFYWVPKWTHHQLLITGVSHNKLFFTAPYTDHAIEDSFINSKKNITSSKHVLITLQ
jgi:hypothetical protein